MPAWRLPGGEIGLRKQGPMRLVRTRDGKLQITDPDTKAELQLPCGKCLGCRSQNNRGWALRCYLELEQHDRATFTTLTYAPEHLPPTLAKRHLQLFLKRLRRKLERSTPARALRFFASGEYGETTHRPHYHAILYGIDADENDLIEEAWGLGHARSAHITPERISYIAGYTYDKLEEEPGREHERVDLTTGEIYRWQPPFRQMSRRPGIGGHARQYVQSWRLTAIHNGTKMPVPRFLHEAWKAQATEEQINQLLEEKKQIAQTKDRTRERLTAAEQIAKKRQEINAVKRTQM